MNLKKNIAVSLIDLSGDEYPLENALDLFLSNFDNRCGCLITASESVDKKLSNRIENLISEWRKRSVLFGREVSILSPGAARFKAVPYDIDSKGRLLVKDLSGKNLTVEFEEATLFR